MNAKKNLMAFILTVSSIALMVICLGLGMVKACAGGDGSEWKPIFFHIVHQIQLPAGFHAERITIYRALAAPRPVAMPMRNHNPAAVDVTPVSAQRQIHRYSVVTQKADIRPVLLPLRSIFNDERQMVNDKL